MSALQKPQKLTTVAILQIVSGVLQFPVACLSAGIIGFGLAMVMGVLTIWMGGLGAICGYCGMVAYLLIPIGLVEIISGILILAMPKPPPLFIKITAGLEVFSLLLGGIPAAIVGVINFMLLRDEEVVAYLEDPVDY